MAELWYFPVRTSNCPDFEFNDFCVQAGDAILSIDGRSTAGLSMADIRAGIVGIQGSSVRIGFQRNNGDPYEVMTICPESRTH